MMSTITVETECGTRQWYDNRRDAEASKRLHRERCEECDEEDIRVAVDPDQSTLEAVARADRTDGGDGSRSDAGSGSAAESAGTAIESGTAAVSRSDSDSGEATDGPSALEPVLEGREYAGVARRRDIAVQAEAITTAGETDHEYAEFKATAWRKDEGPENGYTGHATARVAEGRRGIEHRLNEVAETRAMKRAVAWAAGIDPAGDGATDAPEGV